MEERKNIPHEEVFRDCTIFGIFFDSCIALARQANRHEMLFERSEFFASEAAKPSALNDYENRTSGL